MKKVSNLVDHAKLELEKSGLLDKDSDYNGEIGKSVLELIEVLAKQGHSGGSVWLTLGAFAKLANFENLSPLTSDPNEWRDMSIISGEKMWQNIRNPKYFSRDGGKTMYSI